MRQSVSACFCFEDQVFVIERQDHLSVFPGYLAFPGGKVDKNDSLAPAILNPSFAPGLMNALVREMQEELGIDLALLMQAGEILSINSLGVAVTPDFNPYRFENFYFKIELARKLDLVAHTDEAKSYSWISCQDLLARYHNCEVIAVPPMVKLLTELGQNPQLKNEIDLGLNYLPHAEVPMIESIYGVKQFLPLSHTFPPANRTNCFLIGDEGTGTPTLIDPSPQDESEYQKLRMSLAPFEIEQILITHHHPDHHEQAPRLARELGVKILLSADTHQRILKRHGPDYFEGVLVREVGEGDVICHSRTQAVRVYEVPGHDEGQLALAPADLHWFLVGDLIQTIGTVVIGHPEGDMKKYFASLERVIELAPKFIIPSHGIALGGTHKLAMTLKHRQHREEQIAELYLKGQTPAEILDVVYEGLEVGLRVYALKTIDAHLRKLASEERLNYSSQLN